MARSSKVEERDPRTGRTKAPRRERPWTPAGDMVLMQLHEEGYTTGQIGRILNRTSQSVGRRLSVLRQRGFRLERPRSRAADFAWPSQMGVVSGHLY
ncbi:helix-turn-helix domain-containing protein [Limnochorda pilosa]|uniref:Uncharacterized protein n=1 Tax=Limnochorda pilosa TaxID=1555112 RepID=A0A0K2SPA8_LIMPI|nr:hypothetical protein [Limnochorda pilosa]BAS28960.1 hypothetical protein LIP_3132 [Limnochorda pilosa]